jgi:hypothetical protein
MVQATAKPSKRRAAAKPVQDPRRAGALKRANAEHKVLVRYLQAAVGVLPKAECQLLLDFAEIAKGKSERLRRALRPCSRPRAAWPVAEA